jgi:hypothetical protein
MTKPTGGWALETLPVFDEFYAAIEQMSLEAGAAGDCVTETGSLEAAVASVDLARERVALAAEQSSSVRHHRTQRVRAISRLR